MSTQNSTSGRSFTLPRIVIEISAPTGRSLGKFGRSSSTPHLASAHQVLMQHDHDQRTALRKVSAVYPSSVIQQEKYGRKFSQTDNFIERPVDTLKKTSRTLSESSVGSSRLEKPPSVIESAAGRVMHTPVQRRKDSGQMNTKGKPQRWTA